MTCVRAHRLIYNVCACVWVRAHALVFACVHTHTHPFNFPSLPLLPLYPHPSPFAGLVCGTPWQMTAPSSKSIWARNNWCVCSCLPARACVNKDGCVKLPYTDSQKNRQVGKITWHVCVCVCVCVCRRTMVWATVSARPLFDLRV